MQSSICSQYLVTIETFTKPSQRAWLFLIITQAFQAAGVKYGLAGYHYVETQPFPLPCDSFGWTIATLIEPDMVLWVIPAHPFVPTICPANFSTAKISSILPECIKKQRQLQHLEDKSVAELLNYNTKMNKVTEMCLFVFFHLLVFI